MQLEQELNARIERLAPKWIEFLRRLVTTPSVLGAEQACLDITREAMRGLGVYARDVRPGAGEPYVPTGRSYAGRGCLVGRVAGASGGPVFALNAHMDTAPVEDPQSWRHPPFGAVIEDGLLFGRGAMDDKAGVAMLLLLAEVFASGGPRLPGDLLLEVVVEDEDSGNGTLACTLAGCHADAGIIIDGTWPFRIIDAHLGQIWFEARIAGTPVAACSQERGVNPVFMAMSFIERLRALTAEGNARGPWRGVEAPWFLNVGTVHAGVWPGAVPETCTVSFQLGFPPPETPETVFALVQELAREAVPGESAVLVPGSLWTAPFANPDNPLARLLARTIARRHPGEMDVRAVAVKGHCDLRHMRRVDGTLADACLYGPGGGGNPHARDEHYRLDHFVPVAQNIASAILEWSAGGKLQQQP
jgi:acetylornithine deacetylase